MGQVQTFYEQKQHFDLLSRLGTEYGVESILYECEEMKKTGEKLNANKNWVINRYNI